MTVPTGAKLRATARFNRGGYGDVMNVFYFLTDFTAPQAEEDVFDGVDALLSSVFIEFDQYLVNLMDPVDLKVDVVSFNAGRWEVTANVGFGAWGSTITTAEVNEQLPPGAAALVKLRTSLGKHWGRKFVGFFTELMNLDGYLSSTLVSALVTGFAKLIGPYTITTGVLLQPVVLDTITGVTRAITEVAVNGQWSYQRRRRPGVGS